MKKKSKIIKKKWWKILPDAPIWQFSSGDITCMDALTFLEALKEESADIIFIDPPFNLGKKYGKRESESDRLKDQIYLEYMIKILHRSFNVLKEGGALYLYHLPKIALKLGSVIQEKLEFRHWIAISMKNGFARGNFLYPAHYALLYFSKGSPETFDRPKIKIQSCRHCGNSIKDYGGYKKFVQNGINLSDIWEDISPVRHKKYKQRISNELPPEILERVVNISGTSKGVLVDPFAGTGTALMAAKKKGMRFVGCDREMLYVELIKGRLGKTISGKKRL